MYHQSISSLFILISIFLVVVAENADSQNFHIVRRRGFPDLFFELDHSNAYNLLPAGAEIQKIQSARFQTVAGTNFRIDAEVLINGTVKPYCFEAHRTEQRVFSVKNATSGACKFVDSK